jgi:hypothetical protein
MDVNKLLKALDDNSNEHLFNYTTDKLREMNFKIIKELQLSKEHTLDLMNKLKDYKYVDEMNDLKYGTYIRWIPLIDATNIVLTKGAIFCEYKITDGGVFIVCKNFGFSEKKFFQFKMDECIVFQKLTNQEQVLLSALDHLSK